MPVAPQKRRPLYVDVNQENRYKSSGKTSGECGGCFGVVTLFYAKKNPLRKPTGVLEHCRGGETNCWLSIFRVVSF
jgi:hypothetical protein